MDRSSSATIPSSTAEAPLYSFPVNSIFSLISGDKSYSWLYTSVTIVASLLVLEQVVYRIKKRHLPGSSWTIPLIGKFADSMSPTIEGYKRQWNSGDLSALSVFNMFVSIRFTCPKKLTVIYQLYCHGFFQRIRTQDSQFTLLC